MDYKDTFDHLVKMLFEAVGNETPKPEDYDKLEDEWYLKTTWTKAQEEQFRKEAAAYLKKRHRWSKKTITRELGMFLLCYGWRTV